MYILQDDSWDGGAIELILQTKKDVELVCDVFGYKPEDFSEYDFDDNLIKAIMAGKIHYRVGLRAGKTVANVYPNKSSGRIDLRTDSDVITHTYDTEPTYYFYGYYPNKEEAIKDSIKRLDKLLKG